MAHRDRGDDAELKQFGVDEATRTIMQRKSPPGSGDSGSRSSRKKASKNLPQATDDAMEFLLTTSSTSPLRGKATHSPIRPSVNSKTVSETEGFSTPLSLEPSQIVDCLPPRLDLNDAANNNVFDSEGGAFADVPELEDVPLPKAQEEEETLSETHPSLDSEQKIAVALVTSTPDLLSFETMTSPASKSTSSSSNHTTSSEASGASPNAAVAAAVVAEPTTKASKSSKKKKNKANNKQSGHVAASDAQNIVKAAPEPCLPPTPIESIQQPSSSAPEIEHSASNDEIQMKEGLVVDDDDESKTTHATATGAFVVEEQSPDEDGLILETFEEEAKVPEKDLIIPSSSERLARDWEFKHNLPADLNPLVLKIDEFKKSFAAPSAVPLNVDGGGHVRFRITRSLSSDPHLSPQSVFRRFRDFQALLLRLKHCFPFKILPALPSMTFFSRMVMSEEDFLNLRARRLEAFLYALLRDQVTIWKSVDLQAFLLKESEEFDEMAVKYLKNAGQDLDVPPAAVTEKLLSNSFSYLLRFVGNAPSPPGTAAAPASSPQGFREALELAVKPVSHYKDKGEDKDRANMFEHLTECLEQHLSLSQSKSALLHQLCMDLDDVAGFEGLGLAAFDSKTELDFSNGLVREPQPLGQSYSGQGALRSSHQCASLLGGMNEVYQAVLHSVEQGSAKESDVDEFKGEVIRVQRTVSALASDLAFEFTMESLQKASHERQRLGQTLKNASVFSL